MRGPGNARAFTKKANSYYTLQQVYGDSHLERIRQTARSTKRNIMPRTASHIQNQTRTLLSLLRGIESAVYTARDATTTLKTVVELMESVSTDRNGLQLLAA